MCAQSTIHLVCSVSPLYLLSSLYINVTNIACRLCPTFSYGKKQKAGKSKTTNLAHDCCFPLPNVYMSKLGKAECQSISLAFSCHFLLVSIYFTVVKLASFSNLAVFLYVTAYTGPVTHTHNSAQNLKASMCLCYLCLHRSIEQEQIK